MNAKVKTTAASAQAAQPGAVVVTLARPHTHAGVDYAVGEQLQVDPSTAQWLQSQQIATPAQ